MTPLRNEPELWAADLRWPGDETHKHLRGRMGVVSGPALRTGAARLAARAGLRVGAGLVTVLAPPSAAPVLAQSLEAVMLRSCATASDVAAAAASMGAVVLGPAAGIDARTRSIIEALAPLDVARVLDADALTIIAEDLPGLAGAIGAGDVITPHEGEFERLFPGRLATGREAAASAAAERLGCVVVLKGARTLIAAPDGALVENHHASPWLATAGSGDVLAGLIAGLLAQGVPAFKAASAAVWMHGDAALRFGPGLIAEDLPELIPAVLAGLAK